MSTPDEQFAAIVNPPSAPDEPADASPAKPVRGNVVPGEGRSPARANATGFADLFGAALLSATNPNRTPGGWTSLTDHQQTY